MPSTKRKYSGPPAGIPLKKPKKFSAVVASANSYGPLGSSQKASLVYSDKIAIGNNATFVFSANNLYDPNVSGVGHQPRGWDQLISLYNHAVVIKCKIELWSVSTGAPILLSSVVKPDNVISADYRDSLELNPSKHVMLGRDGFEGTYHSMVVYPNKFMGRSNPLSDPTLKNSQTSGPAEQCYIHINNSNFGGVAGDDAECFIKITYDAIFIEPRNPGLS